MNLEIDSNTKAATGEKWRFDLPFFAMPGLFNGFAEQGTARAKEGCGRMKTASGEIADILREACSTNAKGAADYGAKVIEISNANTNSAFDFMARLMDTRSMSDIVDLSATQVVRLSKSRLRRTGSFGSLLRGSRPRRPSRSRRA